MCCAIFACLAPNSILASGTVRSPSSLGLTRLHRKKNTHDPKCLARSACRYLQPTNVRVAGNLIAARKSMIWKMDENGDDLLFQLGYYTGGNLSWFCCPTRSLVNRIWAGTFRTLYILLVYIHTLLDWKVSHTVYIY